MEDDLKSNPSMAYFCATTQMEADIFEATKFWWYNSGMRLRRIRRSCAAATCAGLLNDWQFEPRCLEALLCTRSWRVGAATAGCGGGEEGGMEEMQRFKKIKFNIGWYWTKGRKTRTGARILYDIVRRAVLLDRWIYWETFPSLPNSSLWYVWRSNICNRI